MKKTFLILFILALVGGGAWVVWRAVEQESRNQEGEGNTDRVFEIERRTLKETIQTSGIVEPDVSIEVRSEISGRIDEILVEEGDRVEKDQVLAVLDRTALLNDLTEAQRNLDAYRLRLERAQRDMERLERLAADEFAREQDYLDAQTDFELAGIEYEVRQTRLETSQDNLEKATIRAPREGVISELNVNEGQVIVGATSVNQGTLLMKVNDLRFLVVRANINELEVVRINDDNAVQVTFDAIEDLEIDGTIRRISRFGISQNNSRVFPVEVVFEAIDERIRPGITANLNFPIKTAEDVPAVLISAVFNLGGDRKVVNIVTGEGTTETRDIETGIRDSRFVEIVSGAEVGEKVSLSRPTGAERVRRLDD